MVERYQKVSSSRVHKTMSGISLEDLLWSAFLTLWRRRKTFRCRFGLNSRREENVGFWARNADLQHAGIREAQIAESWRTDGQ
jgi:hypothetical protein